MCLFCQIVSGEVEAEIVLDEEHVVGFLDIRPVFKGHTLLVPRESTSTRCSTCRSRSSCRCSRHRSGWQR